MEITSATEILDISGNIGSYRVVKNGITIFVPNDPDNSDYALMMREVDSGQLTITPAS